MIQMFTPEINRDPLEEKAFEVFQAMVEPLKSSLNDMFDEAYVGPELGTALYNANASPIRSVWDNLHTTVIYPYWHELYENLQTADQLIEFINALYKDADLTIDVIAPLVISFGVDVNYFQDIWWNRDGRYNLEVIPGDSKEFEDDKEAQIFMKDDSVDEEGFGIVFQTVGIPVSDDAISKIFRDVVYPGLHYTSTVIK